MLDGLPGAVASLVFSKDGRRLIGGTFLNQVLIWDWVDPITGEEADDDDENSGGGWKLKQTITCKSASTKDKLFKTSQTHTIKALAISPDDSYFAVGSIDKNIRIYKTDAKGAYQEVQRLKTKTGFLDSEIGYLSISPDGKFLAAATVDTGNKVFIYGITGGPTFSYLGAFKTNEAFGEIDTLPFIRSLALGPDGRLAVATDERVKVLPLNKDGPDPDGETFLLEVDEGEVKALAFSPDGAYLAIATDAGWLQVYGKHESDMKKVADRNDLCTPLVSVAFSPDGKLIAGGGLEGSLNVWKRGAEGEEDWVFATTVEVDGRDSKISLAFQPGDGKKIATGSQGAVRTWTYEL